MIREENPAPTAEENKDEYSKEKFLDQVYMTEAKYDRLVAVLTRKKNIILQGAPGVEKTYAAKRLAYSIMGEKDDDRIEFVQFHQNYSYEDFMMGYKPIEDGFELKYGIFYRFCQKSANHPDKDYFFIIDEINRGNMSKIFGELLMLIEADYRETKTTLAYNGLSFSVPKRLHIISHQEELTVMRGKINMPGTIKNKLLHKQVLTCDFDELSENNMLNQILKTTVMLLLRNGKVKVKYKDDLKKKMLYFSNVDSIEPTEIKWSSIRFQRNNQIYRMLVNICQLIIEGMLLYAKTEEEIQPDNVYQMHGSQISVKTLDLNLPFVEIAAQMDGIVESHFTGVIKAD